MVWRKVGGPLAWSDEVAMLAQVDYDLRVLAWQKTEAGSKGSNPPQPMTPPKSAIQAHAEQQKLQRRADRYLERQRKGGD